MKRRKGSGGRKRWRKGRKEAKQAATLVMPQVYLLDKDHKDPDAEGLSKTRPVCTASETMNQELSEWVTSFVDAALDQSDNYEVISTEEMLAKVDAVNAKWEEEGKQYQEDDITVLSLDEEALYPSLDTSKVAKLCGRVVEGSELKVEGMDQKWTGVYIALTCTKAEISRSNLNNIVPSMDQEHRLRT